MTLITVTECIRLLKAQGLSRSRQRIYEAGKEKGFTVALDEGTRWVYNKDKFLDWVEEIKKTVPDGYAPLIKTAKQLGIGREQMRYQVAKGNIDSITLGNVKERHYVNEKQAREVFNGTYRKL